MGVTRRSMVMGAALAAAAMVAAPERVQMAAIPAANSIALAPIGQYQSNQFNVVAAEVSAYDRATRRLFVVNVAQARIDVVDISDPTKPFLTTFIDVTPYGKQANSVAAHNGVIAVGVENVIRTDPGKVVFFNAFGTFLSAVTVGVLPDCVNFSPNGALVLVANEGEPNQAYTIDPEGSISVIDMGRGVERLIDADVTHVGFSLINKASLDPSVRIFGPNASVAQDLEPEYVSVSPDSQTAWVTLQENNAIAAIDLRGIRITGLLERIVDRWLTIFFGQPPSRPAKRQDERVTRVTGLGFKDHSVAGNNLDASDPDNAINIANWPVKGMYQPDGMDTFVHRGQVYLVTANEGDVREYTGFNASGNEARRVGASSYVLDPTAFPNAASLKQNSMLGRLNATVSLGDVDNDGDFDQIYAFGARSFSIWNSNLQRVFDSGDHLERLTAATFPANFNASNSNNTFDNRSDDKGPEPEGVATAELFGRTYLFVALERIGGIAVYDLASPTSPSFVQYINTRDFTVTPSAASTSDLGPETVLVISAHSSPNGKPLVVVSNEVSGTVRIFEVQKQ